MGLNMKGRGPKSLVGEVEGDGFVIEDFIRNNRGGYVEGGEKEVIVDE
jgi:hypothetical protein